MRLIDLATISREHFFIFVNKCNKTYRSGDDLSLYRELIVLHRKFGNLKILLEKDSFCRKIYKTLEAWDMNKRGARLTSYDTFKKSLEYNKDCLIRLYKYKLHEINTNNIMIITDLLKQAFLNLRVMESKRKIVGVSKALHFLLPDLIMPIDSKYTITAYYGYNKYSNKPKKEFIMFKEIFNKSLEITNRLQLTPKDVDGHKWAKLGTGLEI